MSLRDVVMPVEDDLQVSDVRARRSGPDEIVQTVEEDVGVVVVEIAAGIEAGRRRACGRRRVDDRAGGVGRTVDAIGADAGGDHLFAERVQVRQHRERKLLVAAASAGSRHRHRGLA